LLSDQTPAQILLSVTLLVGFCSIVQDFKRKSIIFISIYSNTPGRKCPRIGAYGRKSSHSFNPSIILPEDLPKKMFEEIGGQEILIPEKPLSLRELQKHCVLKVLQETGGNKKKASEILGIDRTTLYKILEKEDVYIFTTPSSSCVESSNMSSLKKFLIKYFLF
jgi:hypothetical protein